MANLIRFFCTVLLLAECTAQEVILAPPPNLHSTGKNFPEEDVPLSLRNTSPNIFFVTDRSVEGKNENGLIYDAERSDGMVFGASNVQFGASDWVDLVDRT